MTARDPAPDTAEALAEVLDDRQAIDRAHQQSEHIAEVLLVGAVQETITKTLHVHVCNRGTRGPDISPRRRSCTCYNIAAKIAPEVATALTDPGVLDAVKAEAWDEAVRAVAAVDPRAIHNPYRAEETA